MIAESSILKLHLPLVQILEMEGQVSSDADRLPLMLPGEITSILEVLFSHLENGDKAAALCAFHVAV